MLSFNQPNQSLQALFAQGSYTTTYNLVCLIWSELLIIKIIGQNRQFPSKKNEKTFSNILQRFWYYE
jgi:hypothetical protein